MAVLAADGELGKRRFLKTAVPLWDQTRLPTMADDATGQNGTIKTVVAEFIAGRECPAMWFRIERKRCFEKVVPLRHDRAAAIGSRTDDPFDLLRFTKDVFAVGCSFVLALIKIAIADNDVEMAVERGIKHAARCWYSLEKCRRDHRHRAAHVGAHERFVDARVAFGANVGANIAAIGGQTLVGRRNWLRKFALKAQTDREQQHSRDRRRSICDRPQCTSPCAT